jgi:hypothetical protein
MTEFNRIQLFRKTLRFGPIWGRAMGTRWTAFLLLERFLRVRPRFCNYDLLRQVPQCSFQAKRAGGSVAAKIGFKLLRRNPTPPVVRGTVDCRSAFEFVYWIDEVHRVIKFHSLPSSVKAALPFEVLD